MALRFLSTSVLALLLALPAGAFVPGELVRATRGEMLQFQGKNFVSAAKGQEFPVLQHDAVRGLVFVPFVKPDGSIIAVQDIPVRVIATAENASGGASLVQRVRQWIRRDS